MTLTKDQALKAAAQQFDSYAKQHQAKGTPESTVKAIVNRDFATHMQEALSFDYIELASRTTSDKFNGDLVPFVRLRLAMEAFMRAASDLDMIKKLLFYGEDHKKSRFALTSTSPGSSQHAITALVAENEDGPNIFPNEAADIIHGVLGSATETGEMVECIYKAIFEGEALDLTNLTEEVFDDQWYHALICRVAHMTFEEGQRRNINKLRKRFPDRFTSDAANNRDLASERIELEGGRTLDVPADEPYLGLATNQQLINELEARKSMGHDHPLYRTVDDPHPGAVKGVRYNADGSEFSPVRPVDLDNFKHEPADYDDGSRVPRIYQDAAQGDGLTGDPERDQSLREYVEGQDGERLDVSHL